MRLQETAGSTRHADAAESEDVVRGDITQLADTDIPEHDLLTAGFPCQPFSSLGDQPGLDDEVNGQSNDEFSFTMMGCILKMALRV